MRSAIKSVIKLCVPARFRPGLRAVFTRARFAGLRYKCPLCASCLKTFLPHGLNHPVLTERKVVGGGYRKNSRCPVCGSVDRERLLYLFLMQKTDVFKKPIKLLHVAPEKRVSDVLSSKKNLEYLTADLCMENVTVTMDIEDIQFPDASFDAIICNHVLEHVLDDRQAISELYRVLKPGGWAILQVPISLTLNRTYEDPSITTSAGRELAFGQKNHLRIYAKDYEARLAQAGLTVEVFCWTAEAEQFGGQSNKFGLLEEECIYFARKP